MPPQGTSVRLLIYLFVSILTQLEGWIQQTSPKNTTLVKESGLCEHKNYSTSRMHCDVHLFYCASQ
jgi:hypothetical protein